MGCGYDKLAWVCGARSQDAKALKTLERVLAKFPNANEAKAALAGMKTCIHNGLPTYPGCQLREPGH